jgi:hypothetical protein
VVVIAVLVVRVRGDNSAPTTPSNTSTTMSENVVQRRWRPAAEHRSFTVNASGTITSR